MPCLAENASSLPDQDAFRSELSQTLSQRPPALTDANDAESAKMGGLLTPTDAHRRNYSPPEPKVVGSSQSLALARDLDAPAVAPLRPWRRIPPGVLGSENRTVTYALRKCAVRRTFWVCNKNVHKKLSGEDPFNFARAAIPPDRTRALP